MRASFSKLGSELATATVAVLAFHRVGPLPPGSWETWFWLPEATFVRFLDELAGGGWQPVTIETFLDALDRNAELPERAALITFDDGYRATADCVRRCLGERGWPGVFFVPSDFVGRTNGFEAETDEPDEELCSADELAVLARSGISVQSHGASHRPLSTLDRGEQLDDLCRSKATLEHATGAVVETLAYPYGDVGDSAAVRAAGYRVAFGYGGGAFRLAAADRFHLPRLAVGPDTDLSAFLEDR